MGEKMVGVTRFIFALFLCVSTLGFSADVSWKVVTALDAFEPFDAHVFHDGTLWVGRSRHNLGSLYKIEVYDNSGAPLFEKELQHSPRFLYPYGAHGVLSVGISYKDNMSYYSIIERKGGKFQVTTKMIPLGAYANEWAGKPGTLYFTDPGGYDAGEPIGTTLRTLFTMRGNSFNYLAPRIPGPHHPLMVGNKLFLIEHPTIASGGRYLDLVDVNQSKPERVVTAVGSFSQIVALDNDKLLAIADNRGDEIVLFDIASKKVLRKMSVEAGAPRSVAVMGKCLVAGAEYAKKLVFFNWSTGDKVAEWDLSGVGDKLVGISSVAADSVTGRVYVRSNNPASVTEPLKSPDRNSVLVVEETSQATREKCN